VKRALYTGDCLDIMNEHISDQSIDLIYLDPPFNSNSHYSLPFKNKDRSMRPAEAFNDTWRWTAQDADNLRRLEKNPLTRSLAAIVKFAQEVEQTGRAKGRSSLAAYLMNMILRLRAMRRVLKETGSVYLHCDPTAGHYLKLAMDAVFGYKNFRNEIVWGYRTGGVSKKRWPRKHDVILCYGKSNNTLHNPLTERIYYDKPFFTTNEDEDGRYYADVYVRDVWTDIKAVINVSKERLGYPTQKPLALLERVIKASSNPGDLVLDTFCGCGTTVHAAESLNRQWIGIDISPFSAGLIRERIRHNFQYLKPDDIYMWGAPATVEEARQLASDKPFEFEKWVCGAVGANGMYKNPGERGADGGVDGVMEMDVIRKGKVHEEYVIIQVKGGNVTPDSVKALSETVRRLEAVAGIMVCFDRQMGTVENQRSQETWSDDYETYPVIQGYSIEDLLQDKPLKLPPRYGKRRGARMSG